MTVLQTYSISHHGIGNLSIFASTYLEIANFVRGALSRFFTVLNVYFNIVELFTFLSCKFLHISRSIHEIIELLLDGNDSRYLAVELSGQVLSTIYELCLLCIILNLFDARSQRASHFFRTRLYCAVNEVEIKILHYSHTHTHKDD